MPYSLGQNHQQSICLSLCDLLPIQTSAIFLLCFYVIVLFLKVTKKEGACYIKTRFAKLNFPHMFKAATPDIFALQDLEDFMEYSI